MKNFVHRPIPRLLRYKLLLGAIFDGTATGHEDPEAIPAVLNVIGGLEKEIEPRIMSAMQKVELWRYNAGLVFKTGEHIVCFFLPCQNARSTLMPNRTWTCSTRIGY